MEIIKVASDINYSRTCIYSDFIHKWCYSFFHRYQDMITKIKAQCQDDDRSSIDIKEVERYINKIEEIMKDPPNPYLLINFYDLVKEKMYTFIEIAQEPHIGEKLKINIILLL